MTDEPNLRLLSLGAGVQSTTLALLAVEGALPGLDGAIFADTGWEPASVYRQLERVAAVLAEAGIPLHRVNQGNLREDAINPEHRFASVPYYVLADESMMVDEPTEWGPCPPCAGREGDSGCLLCEGSGQAATAWRPRPATRREREGMGRRQCTSEYKLAPIARKVRELLGAAAPDYRRVPRGKVAEQWIGFSTDEVGRVSDKHGTLYERKRYPLLELGMSRKDCERFLQRRGWGDTAKSACIGCPFHGNQQWRDLRDNRPDEWADAVEFDRQIRRGGSRELPLDGSAYLHRSRVPLDLAPIHRVTRAEWADRQMDIFDVIEDGDPDGCSPYGCRSGEAAS